MLNLTSPNNEALTWSQVLLDWDAFPGVNFYDLALDTSPNFDSPELFEISKDYINTISSNNDTRHTISELLFGATYYWRVRARTLVDTSAWNTRQFSTRNMLNLTSPNNEALTWSQVLLDWDAFPGVNFYDLALDTSPNFDSPELFEISKDYINTISSNNDTRHTISELLFGATYYWRVRARTLVDTSAWNTRQFSTRNMLNLTSPNNEALTWSQVLLDWDAFPGVNFYDLALDTSPNFDSPELFEISKDYINTISSNNDTRYTVSELLFGITYYWRVRARTLADTSAWNTRQFSTRSSIEIISPSQDALTWSQVKFDWNAYPNVTGYEFELDTVSSFSSPIKINVFKEYLGTNNNQADTEITIDTLLFGANYYWRVRAVNNSLLSEWDTRELTVRNQVELISPNQFAVNIPVNGTILNWQSFPAVDFYEFQLDTTPFFTSPYLMIEELPYLNASNNGMDTQKHSGVLLENTNYFWRVRAVRGLLVTEWTERQFTTNSCFIPYNIGFIQGEQFVCPNNIEIYEINDVAGALNYTWELPFGWSGLSNSNQIEVTPGALSGAIRVRANFTCGSSIFSSIQVEPIEVTPIIFWLNDSLQVNQNYDSYQWYNCQEETLVEGANNYYFIPEETGSYKVIAIKDDCTFESSCFFISTTSLASLDFSQKQRTKVYPNPSQGTFFIEGLPNLYTIQIVDMLGSVLKNISGNSTHSKNKPLSLELPQGVFMLAITDKTKNHTITKKIIVK
jgi:hypothetical protein